MEFLVPLGLQLMHAGDFLCGNDADRFLPIWDSNLDHPLDPVLRWVHVAEHCLAAGKRGLCPGGGELWDQGNGQEHKSY